MAANVEKILLQIVVRECGRNFTLFGRTNDLNKEASMMNVAMFRFCQIPDGGVPPSFSLAAVVCAI